MTIVTGVVGTAGGGILLDRTSPTMRNGMAIGAVSSMLAAVLLAMWTNVDIARGESSKAAHCSHRLVRKRGKALEAQRANRRAAPARLPSSVCFVWACGGS